MGFSKHRWWCGSIAMVAAIGFCAVATDRSGAATSSPASPSAVAATAATPADPQLVLGSQACVKCHESEVRTWKGTPHAKTFDELHRRPEAQQIAAKLGIRSIKHEGRCVACHYTTQVDHEAQAQAISGVSCESCHGAAKHWVDVHADYGGEHITRATESPAHRQARVSRSIAAGMRNPHNVFLVAQSCLRCHTTADEELVNVGGHSVGSLEFEFVSWSQGTVRHNFVRSDGKANDPSSPERLRVMFVAGIIAELEAGLRATSAATQKANYGINAAQRTARAAARLRSVAAKVELPQVAAILSAFDGVSLKLNNAAELTAAADQIAELGYRFADQADGESMGALDPFIPTPDRYK